MYGGVWVLLLYVRMAVSDMGSSSRCNAYACVVSQA
jgi:hypothetical protein